MFGPSPYTSTPRELQHYAAPTAPATEVPLSPPAPTWSLAQRIAFRFIFAYLVLFIVPDYLPFNFLLRPLARPFELLWRALVPWVGTHVLHLAKPITVFPNGSGDTTFNYVQLLCVMVLALVATVVWSVLDRRRPSYTRLLHYLRIGIRYTLAFWMLWYGGAKVIKTQFNLPDLPHLTEPVGQMSPMGLLWTMMGYSTAYSAFAGVVESVGGVLLFWRRTTTMGALLVMAAMSNIVMLNFSYDVPVKIFSVHLFLMGLFLAAPQLRRVGDALLLGRAVPAEPVVPHSGRRTRRWGRLALKTAIIITAVGYPLWSSWRAEHDDGDLRVKPPLYGIWEVTSFARNHQEVPPLLTDSTRWRYIWVDKPGSMAVHALNDGEHLYRAMIDTTARRIDLTLIAARRRTLMQTVHLPVDSKTSMALTFTYATPDTSHLVFTGAAGSDSLRITLQRIGPHGFELMDRGFHWINEVPYFR